MDTRFVLQIADAYTYLARYERRERGWLPAKVHRIETPYCDLPRAREDLVPIGRQIGGFVREKHPGGITCRLIIPANWCLFQHVEVLTERFSRSAAEFAFEHFAPVELEHLTCHVTRTGRSEGLVIAVFTDAIKALQTELEDASVSVEVLTADILLTTFGRAAGTERTAFGHILVDQRRLALCVTDDRTGNLKLIRSVHVPECETQMLLRRQLIVSPEITKQQKRHWHIWPLNGSGLSDTLVGLLSAPDVSVEVHESRSGVERWMNVAANADGLPDLQHKTLAKRERWKPVRRRLVGCVTALALVVATYGARLRAHGAAHVQAMKDLEPIRTRIYQEVHPGETVPYGAALRLRSERLKLEGMTSGPVAQSDDRLRPSALGAFTLLHEVTTRVPEDLKLHVNEILLDEMGISLAGRTTSHTAAGDLVQELNKCPTLSADPPRTKLREDKTVDFRIHATRFSHEQDE